MLTWVAICGCSVVYALSIFSLYMLVREETKKFEVKFDYLENKVDKLLNISNNSVSPTAYDDTMEMSMTEIRESRR